MNDVLDKDTGLSKDIRTSSESTNTAYNGSTNKKGSDREQVQSTLWMSSMMLKLKNIINQIKLTQIGLELIDHVFPGSDEFIGTILLNTIMEVNIYNGLYDITFSSTYSKQHFY